MKKQVLLSFDIEEFDFPREKGQQFSVEEGVKVSKVGAEKILKLLEKEHIKATFFVTGNFAKLAPQIIKKMIKDGHEVAAHGVDHFSPEKNDIKQAKLILKSITKKEVLGWRQPRMQKIDYEELSRHGYLYDSSVNPAFIPGRYNNANVSRIPYRTNQNSNSIIEIPASVVTFMRIPLFWLAFHNFPFWFYFTLAKMSMKKTGLLVTYFHPWEFTNLTKYDVVPWYIKRNSNDKLVKRLGKLIRKLKTENCDFVTFSEYASTIEK
ncbi:polysaccharide deacetylase family protein [Candidatus Saccharibacteria bacterium]|nr:polysaccharide deacetylase family protein [Candidatus Saccharibacteria bacterium]